MRKRTFTTAERVLVHLSSPGLQPSEQTQEGIAAATRSGRSTLTKWLDRLERRGFVARDRIRLPRHPLPKYAYRLTERGWQAAAAFQDRLGSELVTVRAPNLGALSVRLTEVPHLASARLDLAGTVAAVRKGRLDLARPPLARRKRGPLIWGDGLRRVDRFFGREDEMRDVDRWWSGRSRGLVLTGLAGIGKSALVAAWAQSRSLDIPVCGFEVRPSLTTAGFMNELGGFLAALGKPTLAVHLDQGVPLDPAFVQRLLDRDFRGERMLLVVDNADQASRDLARLLLELFERPLRDSTVRIIFVGRRLPGWLRSAASSGLVMVRRVRGLRRDASLALLQSHGLGPNVSFAEEVIRKTRGHPLLLHLAASSGTASAPVVSRYLEGEVWDTLSARDRSVLQAVSVFRRAVQERILARVAETDHRELESLADRNLLERTVAGSYLMHDLVREFVRSRLSEARRHRLNVRAADVLLTASDSRERWEGVYHLLAAGEILRAATLLDSEGAPLLDGVAAEEIEWLVRGLSFDEAQPRAYCVFSEILGDSLRIRGHVGPAVYQYGHAQRLAEKWGLVERSPRLLRKLAFLERCRNRYPKALGYLVEAQGRLQKRDDPTERAEVLREMALVEQALGSVAEAARHLSEAIDLATEASDRAALCRTLLALGSLETQRGRHEEGLELDLEGLRVAERSGNLTEIAHSHVVVGAALIELGKAQESLTHFGEGLAAARLLGNLRLIAYATMNRTSALLHLGRYPEARTSLRESMGSFDILEEEDGIGLLKTYEGELEMELGHWSRARTAWRQGIALLRIHGSRAELANVLRDAAGSSAKHGDAAETQAYLSEALEIAQRVGNLDLVAKIRSDLATFRAMTTSKGNP